MTRTSESVGRRLAGGPELRRRQAEGPGRTIPEPPAGHDGMGRNVQTADAMSGLSPDMAWGSLRGDGERETRAGCNACVASPQS